MKFKDRLERGMKRWKRRRKGSYSSRPHTVNHTSDPLVAQITKKHLGRTTSMLASGIVDEYLPYVDYAYAQLSNEMGDPNIRKALPPSLVYAIIMVESRGNPFAIRYEPGFFQWLKNKLTNRKLVFTGLTNRDTEMNARSMSWGLMQIMGQTARQEGFEGLFLAELCDPTVNIYYGLKYFYRQFAKYGSIWDAVSAYNAGTPFKNSNGTYKNQAYVDKVKAAKILFDPIFTEVKL